MAQVLIAEESNTKLWTLIVIIDFNKSNPCDYQCYSWLNLKGEVLSGDLLGEQGDAGGEAAKDSSQFPDPHFSLLTGENMVGDLMMKNQILDALIPNPDLVKPYLRLISSTGVGDGTCCS
jgi:hypothetical protein